MFNFTDNKKNLYYLQTADGKSSSPGNRKGSAVHIPKALGAGNHDEREEISRMLKQLGTEKNNKETEKKEKKRKTRQCVHKKEKKEGNKKSKKKATEESPTPSPEAVEAGEEEVMMEPMQQEPKQPLIKYKPKTTG